MLDKKKVKISSNTVDLETEPRKKVVVASSMMKLLGTSV
jgi:hypothetical protein